MMWFIWRRKNMTISTCKELNVLIAGVLLLAVPGLVPAQDAGAARSRAGAAKVDITPDPSELANSTDIIRDHLYVRAIYIENGSNCAVLVSVAGGARNIDEALQESSASTGCPVENYVVTGTHSHSANTGGIAGGSPTPETIATALVSAVDMAKSHLAPARVGYGTTQLDLNVNRDNFDEWLEWRQTPNWDGVSDKTLSVVTFLGEDDVPIAVYMNYAMHPVNFFMSGVVSADFPGDASTYIEELFDNNTVALFSQGASGDQNPKMAYTSIFRDGPIKGVLPPHNVPATGNQPSFAGQGAVPDENLAAHEKTIERKSDYVHMLGTMIGNSAVRVMLYDTKYEREASIWAGKQNVTCPGRVRLDTEGRENYDPGYEDGPDVTIGVGLLQIGDVNLVTVSGEVYTDIGLRVKAESPASKTMFVTLANGPRGSGYIYSDEASYHLTFQVLGSRLQPGCAEEGIVSAALDLMHQAGQ
jgi:neutral ceramidase